VPTVGGRPLPAGFSQLITRMSLIDGFSAGVGALVCLSAPAPRTSRVWGPRSRSLRPLLSRRNGEIENLLLSRG